jgi:hypothetical protein
VPFCNETIGGGTPKLGGEKQEKSNEWQDFKDTSKR